LYFRSLELRSRSKTRETEVNGYGSLPLQFINFLQKVENNNELSLDVDKPRQYILKLM